MDLPFDKKVWFGAVGRSERGEDWRWSDVRNGRAVGLWPLYLALCLVLLPSSVRHFPFTTTATMAIAPITGKLRKQFWLDVGCAFGLGIAAGYAYW